MKKLSILAILALVLQFGFSLPSLAEDNKKFVTQSVSGTPEYVVLNPKGDGFEVQERGVLTVDKVLPEHCTVCVPLGATAILIDEDGNQQEVVGPDVYDLWLDQKRPYQKERVRVQEGTVTLQRVITVDGKTKPVGAPIIVSEGNFVEADPCFGIVELETLDTSGAEEGAVIPPSPTEPEEDITFDNPSASPSQ